MAKDDNIQLMSTAELEIAEMQLEMLRQKSRVSVLSLEEIKIYDLLCKNLLLIKGQPTGIIETSAKRIESIPNEDLLKIALEDKKENNE